jgi:hypothetical protein
VHDELGDGQVECVVGKRQVLGLAGPHVDAGEPGPGCVDERR